MNGRRTKRELSKKLTIRKKKYFHWFQSLSLVSKLKLFHNFIVKILISYSGSFSSHKYFRSKSEFIRLSFSILSRSTGGKNNLNWIFCYAARQLAMWGYWPSSVDELPYKYICLIHVARCRSISLYIARCRCQWTTSLTDILR